MDKKFSRLSVVVGLFLGLILSSNVAMAQPLDRSFIRQQIRENDQCRNVAITKSNGDLMLYGQNGWAADGCPAGLTQAMNELNNQHEYIDDVQLTESGRWLILYGDNGLLWNNIPAVLEQTLREWNANNEVITSVSFNDDGEWIAVSENYICASDPDIQNWVAEGIDKFGVVWTTCITDDAAVVVYENGFKYLGEIPPSLGDSLDATDIDVYRLKIAGDAWFFSDGVGACEYRL